MKMYILIKESVPLGFALVAAAHASLGAYLHFNNHPDMNAWVEGTFFKAVCAVNDKEFENAKACPDHMVITESALDDQEVAIAFLPRHDDEWPKSFRYYRLYK